MSKKIFLSVLIGILMLILITGCFDKNKQSYKFYDDIINSLSKNNLIPSDWKYVASNNQRGFINNDYSNKYYFYIDKTLYDSYKYYWLEDVDKSEYYDGYNSELSENGDYILKCVNIFKLEYVEDSDNSFLTKVIESENLDKNNSYYLVYFYDKAIYTKWVTKHKNKNDFTTYDWFDVDKNSLTSRYISYQENKEWKFILLED